MSSITRHVASMFEDLHRMLLVHDIRVPGLGSKIEALKAVESPVPPTFGVEALSSQAKIEEAKAIAEEAADKDEPKRSGAAKAE